MDNKLLIPLSVAAGYILLNLVKLSSSDCDLSLQSASDGAITPCFRNKRIWITGGSSGIGKTLALALSKIEGTHILISARSKSALEEVQSEIQAKGGRCDFLVLDLADLKSLSGKVEEAKTILGGDVDILVNNGGVSQRALGIECSLETDLQLLNVNFTSATVITKALVKGWLNRADKSVPKGVISISSLAGKMGIPLRTYYCASKFALIGFMDSLRSEASVEGNIVFSNICPGSVHTGVSANALTGDGKKFGVTDPNIANGMNVERCAQLILRAHANKLPEVWMFGNRTEKVGVYIAQYLPSLFQIILRKNSATIKQKYTEMILALRQGQKNANN